MLLRTLYPKARRHATARLGAQQDVDDVLQEWALELSRALGRFRGESSIGTYSARVLSNVLLRRSRRKAQEVERAERLSDQDAGEGAATPHVECLERRRADALWRCVSELPEPQATVIELRYREELSLEEIAELTDAPLHTVRKRLALGRSRLRKCLEEKPTLRELLGA